MSDITDDDELYATCANVDKLLANHQIMRLAGVAGSSSEGRWLCDSRLCLSPRFEIAIWPGYLVMTGTEGTWVFEQLVGDSLIDVFRSSHRADGQPLSILADRLKASLHDIREYSVDRWRNVLDAEIASREADPGALDLDELRALRAQSPETLEEADELLMTVFDYGTCPDVLDYTYEFVWACRAITWFARHVQIEVAVGNAAAQGAAS